MCLCVCRKRICVSAPVISAVSVRTCVNVCVGLTESSMFTAGTETLQWGSQQADALILPA